MSPLSGPIGEESIMDLSPSGDWWEHDDDRRELEAGL